MRTPPITMMTKMMMVMTPMEKKTAEVSVELIYQIFICIYKTWYEK